MSFKTEELVFLGTDFCVPEEEDVVKVKVKLKMGGGVTKASSCWLAD